jgi:glycogen debranching enzyme
MPNQVKSCTNCGGANSLNWGKSLLRLTMGRLPTVGYANDTTLLWIITLAETYQWTGDRNLLDDCDPPLAKALQWIDEYGDFDGDGFVEYLSRSTDGIQNQGWKMRVFTVWVWMVIRNRFDRSPQMPDSYYGRESCRKIEPNN